ncbi:hypothetical protein SO802_021514 [Lithocarpus litseifolius]|uniref:Uncharacterized protein n=1 Tax=Lithocarpus litseifolius TaxID=425828 RepID=A0AAW2CH74_9ROSI
MMENEMIKWFIDNLKSPYYEQMISTQVSHFASLIPIRERIDEGIKIAIEEIIESPTNSGSSDSGKGQAQLIIEGFTPLVLALPVIAGPASSLVQEGTAIVPTI